MAELSSALSTAGALATLGGAGTAAGAGTPEAAGSAGGVKVGMSCSVRTASITASVESSTAAAAAIGQRGILRAGAAVGAAASRGPAWAWR
ncbi:MAG TPA: hypothetical protein PKV98_17845, partial [Burkholderiaceae bacterium]|nr:hypothetical protein [Burkholderiaceae bacterium]